MSARTKHPVFWQGATIAGLTIGAVVCAVVLLWFVGLVR